MVFQRSMLNWKEGWGQPAMGICALCYIYMKLIWCNGFPEIYASRSAKFGVVVFKASMLYYPGGRSASRSSKFGVVVFKASMLN